MGYYLFVRTTQTLNLKPEFLWYGIVTLVIECLGAVSVAVYGINHLWYANTGSCLCLTVAELPTTCSGSDRAQMASMHSAGSKKSFANSQG